MAHFFVVTDLGMLPGGNSSFVAAISDRTEVIVSAQVAE